jgi:hypothetical protein
VSDACECAADDCQGVQRTSGGASGAVSTVGIVSGTGLGGSRRCRPVPSWWGRSCPTAPVWEQTQGLTSGRSAADPASAGATMGATDCSVRKKSQSLRHVTPSVQLLLCDLRRGVPLRPLPATQPTARFPLRGLRDLHLPHHTRSLRSRPRDRPRLNGQSSPARARAKPEGWAGRVAGPECRRLPPFPRSALWPRGSRLALAGHSK